MSVRAKADLPCDPGRTLDAPLDPPGAARSALGVGRERHRGVAAGSACLGRARRLGGVPPRAYHLSRAGGRPPGLACAFGIVRDVVIGVRETGEAFEAHT
jgi:hypothetical protein